MTNFKIYYRYDNQKRNLLVDSKLQNNFHGIIINASIALYYHNSLNSFLENFKKPFFIDPITYFLNQSPQLIKKRNGNIRRSYKQVIEQFLNLNEAEIERYVNNNKIFIPFDIDDDDLEKFCKNVIDFQRDFAHSSDIYEFSLEYEEILGTYKELNSVEYIVAPYFTIEDMNTYNLNKRSVYFANDHINPNDPPLCGCFTITKSFFNKNPNIGDQIIDDFPFLKNFIIWVSDFNSKATNVKKLNRLKDLVSKLSNNGKNEVINFYGDYFSLLLSKFGLTGMCSGFGTSTKKRAKLSRGAPGGITERIYVPQLNNEILKDDMRILIRAHPEIICDCVICKRITNNLRREHPDFIINYFNLLMSEKNHIKHFLYTRNSEKEHIESTDTDAIIRDLEIKYDKYSELLYTEHLKNWKDDL